jgi:hypothetical protein
MNAVVWYKSRILQSLLTIVVTQIIAKVTAQYHIDFAVLGLTADNIVQWIMDGISAAAVYWATHARVAPQVPIPPVVTLTQTGADKANIAPLFSPKETPK